MHELGSWLARSGHHSAPLLHIVKDFNSMPKTMVQLAIVQFFSWFALFSMWIYATPAITSHVYAATDTTSKLYNEGADMVSNLFGGYNGIAALAAIFIPMLAKKPTEKLPIWLPCVWAVWGLSPFTLSVNPLGCG